MRWVDGEGQECGGLCLLGGLYLPNHSLTESEETVPSVMGEAKLFILKRSHPAASGKKDTWTEIHGLLPTGHGEHWLDL